MEDEKATYRTLGLETLKIVTTPSGAVEVWFRNRIIVVQPAERVGILADRRDQDGGCPWCGRDCPDAGKPQGCWYQGCPDFPHGE